MGKLYCGCNEAKENCEKTCIKYRNKTYPTQVYLIPTWKKTKKDKDS